MTTGRSGSRSSQLIAYGKRTVTAKLNAMGCDVTAPSNPRDGKLQVRTRSGRRLDVFVSTQRVGGYAFWTKRRLQPAPDRYVVVVLFDAEPSEQLFLIPSMEWTEASTPLTDRDYEGRASEPEYGIELGEAALPLLRRYTWDSRADAAHFA